MRVFASILLALIAGCIFWPGPSNHGSLAGTSSANQSDYSIDTSYPNPFSAASLVTFTLADTDHVPIILFNVLGDTTRTLADSVLYPTGTHHLLWDGSDDTGSPAPAGLYFYRIWTSAYTETKKMVLIK